MAIFTGQIVSESRRARQRRSVLCQLDQLPPASSLRSLSAPRVTRVRPSWDTGEMISRSSRSRLAFLRGGLAFSAAAAAPGKRRSTIEAEANRARSHFQAAALFLSSPKSGEREYGPLTEGAPLKSSRKSTKESIGTS